MVEESKKMDLTNDDQVKQLVVKIDQEVEENNRDVVFRLVNQIRKLLQEEYGDLERSHPETYRELRRAMAKGAWFTFGRQTGNVIEDLFENHLDLSFEYDWEEILSDLERGLALLPDQADRDKEKQRYLVAFAKSRATIGIQDITLGEEKIPPTIASWFKVWREYLKDKEPTGLSIIEFLNSNVDAAKFEDEDKKKLEGVLKLRLAMSKSSMEPENAEDKMMFVDPSSGNYKVFDHGEMVDTGVEAPKEDVDLVRRVQGFREDGTPKSFPELVQSSTLLRLQREEQPDPITTSEGRPDLAQPVKEDSFQPVASYEAPKEVAEEPMPLVESVTLKPEPTPEPIVEPEPEPVVEPVMPEPTPEPVQPVLEDLLPPVTPAEPVTPEPVAPPTPDPAPAPAPAPFPPKPEAPEKKPKKERKKRKRKEKVQKKSDKGIDYADLAQQVLAEHNILLASYDVERRFLSILASYMRGVRDNMEAREALTKPDEEGGVDLSVEKIETILKTADSLLEHAKNQTASTNVRPAPVASAAPKLTFEMAQKQVKEHKQAAPTNDDLATEDISAAPDDVEDIFANITPGFESAGPVDAPDNRLKSITDLKPKSVMTDMNAPAAPQGPQSIQPVMMGPIEELQNMTLVEFRRLGTSPSEASAKILNKIELLMQESIQKKSDGIAAWKESPLNSAYLDIGKESFDTSIPVEEVINRKLKEVAGGLSITEFQAIADLNKRLRF